MIQFLLLFIFLTINHELHCGFFRGHISGQLLLIHTHTHIHIYICFFSERERGSRESKN